MTPDETSDVTTTDTIIRAGSSEDTREKAQEDGYYRDDQGVKRFIAAGDATPPGATMEDGKAAPPSSAGDPAGGKPEKAQRPASDKATKAPTETK